VKGQEKGKKDAEVMHSISNFILDLVLVHYHGKANEDHTGDDKRSSQTGNVTKHQIEIALLTPSSKMKVGMTGAKDENRPSAICMKFVHVTIEKHGNWGIGEKAIRGPKLGNEYHDQRYVCIWIDVK
jgi:hypothetical protein